MAEQEVDRVEASDVLTLTLVSLLSKAPETKVFVVKLIFSSNAPSFSVVPVVVVVVVVLVLVVVVVVVVISD